MKCTKPYTRGGDVYGCGQCRPCRVGARRIWKTRIICEAAQHTQSQFVTLTYEDNKLPRLLHGGLPVGLATLVPRDLQLFLKRLRRDYPTKLRFYAVGEYGDQTFRPHYHAGIFGFQPCERGQTLRSRTGRCEWSRCCPTCKLVGDTWGKGDIEVRALGTEKCEYLARYVVKKMTKKEDARLKNRHPEFSRQSRGGAVKGSSGIGASAVAKMAEVIQQWVEPSELVDVPQVLEQGHKPLVLGRYLRKKLRLALGLPEGTPRHVLQEVWKKEVLPVLLVARSSKEGISLQEAFRQKNQTYSDSLEMKASFRKGKL